MQEKIQLTEQNNIPFFFLPLWEQTGILGHGFSSRLGGVSNGDFFSLNLGFKGGDDPEKVMANRQRFLAIWSKENEALFCGEQVHGTGVAIIGKEEAAAKTRIFPATDALITAEPGVVLGAFCADCLLLFFWEPQVHVVGIAHAGWRGTCEGIAARVVALMRKRFAARPANMQVLLGPSIGPCCYEVGAEVVQSCHRSPWSAEMVLHPGRRADHPHFDLRASNRNVLIKAGLDGGHIFENDYCTKCDSSLFYSYRGSGGRITGSHMGIIFLKDAGLNN